jgi:uncharacterized protein (DUF1330 family)
MAAFIIGRIDVTNPEQYAQYTAVTPEIIASFGGRFVARNGQKETLEGPVEDRRLVILEFPDYASAKAFFDSSTYGQAKKLREGAAQAQFVLIDGYPPTNAQA